MTLPDTRSLFATGMERAAHHWLAYWQQNGYDSEAQRQARGHALRALMWCAEWGITPDTVADLAVALHTHMMRAGQWFEWEPCLRTVLERAGPHICDERRSAVQHCLSTLYFRLHRMEDAIALAEDNVRIALTAADTRRQELATTNLSETYLKMRRYDVAQAYSEEATRLAAALGDAVREADGHINIARALLGLGKVAEAEQHLTRAEHLVAPTSDQVFRCKTRLFQGQAAGARQAWDRALEHFSDALYLVRLYGDEVGYGVVLNNIGRALMELGRWDEADAVLTEALHILQLYGNAPAAQVSRNRLAELRALRFNLQASQAGSAPLASASPAS